MPRIAVLDPDHAAYVRLLDESGVEAAGYGTVEDLVADRPDTEVLFGAAHLMIEAMPSLLRLQWMQSTWAGVERFIDAGVPSHITVTRAVDVFGPSMREYVVGHLLATLLDVEGHTSATTWRAEVAAPLLAGTRVGVMGTGSIGASIAEALGALDVTVVGFSRRGEGVAGFAEVFPADRLDAFATGLHHLVAVLPSTPATDGLVDAALLSRVERGAVFINVGRGQSVVTEDVVALVRSGHLRRAVLDVLPAEPLPDGDPLWTEPGVVVTSHTAAVSTPEHLVPLFVDNLRRWAAGEPLSGVVDFDAGY